MAASERRAVGGYLRFHRSASRTRCVTSCCFQRTIPGFEPSAESYQLAVDAFVLARAGARLRISSQRAFDVFTALAAGSRRSRTPTSPAAKRWVRLVDETTDMFLATYRRKVEEEKMSDSIPVDAIRSV